VRQLAFSPLEPDEERLRMLKPILSYPVKVVEFVCTALRLDEQAEQGQ
jgi:hypothetical protein